MRVVILSSGGKDSGYCLWWSLLKGWDVVGVVTVRVNSDDSMMFQIPSTALAGLQAQAANLPWLPVMVSGIPEEEIDELESALRPFAEGGDGTNQNWTDREWNIFWPDEWQRPTDLHRLVPGEAIDAIVCGALRSDYQKTRIERMAHRLGIKSFTPLWHNRAESHMQDLIEQGFRLLITSVSAQGLDASWLGRELDEDSFKKLQSISQDNRMNLDGEGGEFETAVIDAPWMNYPISVSGRVDWQREHGQFVLESAKLVM